MEKIIKDDENFWIKFDACLNDLREVYFNENENSVYKCTNKHMHVYIIMHIIFTLPSTKPLMIIFMLYRTVCTQPALC